MLVAVGTRPHFDSLEEEIKITMLCSSFILESGLYVIVFLLAQMRGSEEALNFSSYVNYEPFVTSIPLNHSADHCSCKANSKSYNNF